MTEDKVRGLSQQLCAAPGCNRPGTCKNSITGGGSWYCSFHVHPENKGKKAPEVKR